MIYNVFLEGMFGECIDLIREYFFKCRIVFFLVFVFVKDDGVVGNVNGIDGV